MKQPSTPFNRRDFLKVSGLAGAGLVIGISLIDSKSATAATPITFEPNAYLKIGSDGKIIIFLYFNQNMTWN